MTEKGRLKVLIVISVVAITLILVSLLTVSASLFVIQTVSDPRHSNDNFDGFRYRYLKYTPSGEEEYSHHYVNLHEKIDDIGFMSTKEQSRTFEMISRLDLTEYKCNGNCYCDNEERRNVGVSRLFTSPLFYLVAASALSSAKIMSSKYFEEECVDRYSTDNSCPIDLIRSEIDECEEVSSPAMLSEDEKGFKDDESVLTLTDEEIDRLKGKKTMVWKYRCWGNCFGMKLDEGEIESGKKFVGDEVADLLRQNMGFIKARIEGYGCGQLRLEKTLEHTSFPADDRLKIRFAMQYLDKYCKANSVDEFDLINKWGPNRRIKVPLCTNVNEGKMNPTIDCMRQV